MKSIGIQGGRGSFSEEAANQFVLNHGIDDFKIVYQISSASVLNGLDRGKTDFGIIAMENAQGGVVIESIEALAKYKCTIVEMFHISVDQNLLGVKFTNIMILLTNFSETVLHFLNEKLGVLKCCKVTTFV